MQETSDASLVIAKKVLPNSDKKNIVISGTSDAITKTEDTDQQINTETPILTFSISGTPDELLLVFNVICKKFENDQPRQDSPE